MLAAGLLTLASPALAEIADVGRTQVDAKVDACIAAHATQVERAETSLTSGVDFLINDVCGQEVEIAVKYVTNQSVLSQQIKQLNQSLDSQESQPAPPPLMIRPVAGAQGAAGPKPATTSPPVATFDRSKFIAAQRKKLQNLQQSWVDPETGEIQGPAQNPNQATNDMMSLMFGRAPPPARYRASAARALLAAREARDRH
jgi:hypothetical protein